MMSPLYKVTDHLLTAVLVLLGVLGVFTQLLILGGASYQVFRAFILIPLFISAGLFGFISKNKKATSPNFYVSTFEPNRFQQSQWFLIGGAIFVSAIYTLFRHDWLTWALMLAFFSLAIWLNGSKRVTAKVKENHANWQEYVILGSLAVLAVVFTAASLKPDADDAYFLSAASAIRSYPSAPLQSVDAIHRDGLPPVEQMLHIPQVYEIWVGALSDCTGVSLHFLYYSVFPGLFAVFAVLAHWLVLRQFVPAKAALWGVLVFVGLLIFWGDGPKTFGSFGFVRLYQGKSVYLLVLLPLFVLGALRFLHQPKLSTWLLLAISQLAALALTTNAMVVAPVAVSLCLLAFPLFKLKRKNVFTVLLGISASIPLLLLSAGMYFKMAPFLTAITIDKAYFDLAVVFGSVRSPLIVFALVGIPFLSSQSKLAHSSWLKRYLWLITLITLAPAMRVLMAQLFGHVFSWRLLWAVPFPLLVSLAAALALSGTPKSAVPIRLTFLAWALAFAALGPASVQTGQIDLKYMGKPKIELETLAAAKKALVLASNQTLVLAPKEIAIALTGFDSCPPLVGVRPLYLKKLRGIVPTNELNRRLNLFNYITHLNPPWSLETALTELKSQEVDMVVFHKNHRDAKPLMKALLSDGFLVESFNNYILASSTKPNFNDQE